ncbi:MAG: hypothetical protein HUJ96_01635 [Marinilabiliaceae bacterium]|nr:hypothetical protein [Marinilabiliaceae bacterium]
MKIQFIGYVAIMGAALLQGCSCNKNENAAETVTKQNVEENVREFVYPLPTAYETTEMLNRIEAPYIQGLCNDFENSESYMTEYKRALNLGVYSADMCYASTYNQQQTVMDCMDVIKKLIDNLDMTNGVDPELPGKLENSENNKDEITNLITESFYDSYDYLNKNDRGPVSILIVAGSWIEALYVTTHISDNTFDNKEMVKIVMTQRDPLNKLMEILAQKFADNEYAKSIASSLEPLHQIYNSVTDGGISESQIESIKSNVESLRNEIVAK